MSKVMPCTCKHVSQDRLHGLGKRAHNEFIKNNGGFRCTVCLKEKSKQSK